ncbi:MAG: MBL fold metallo-hydrolase [Anaerolineae bacterium]|nr:MBL fold metallo-hydrolase [Anaerolineae bacterium]
MSSKNPIPRLNIVNVGYDSTNYYVLADTAPRLLIDIGFPGTLGKLLHECKRMGLQLKDIKHLLATHYHPDHAGAAQELKDLGVKLIVLESQSDSIPLLKTYMKPEQRYQDINLHDNLLLDFADSRAFLAKIGIQGEIISTPGHSDDSVTLVLDDGSAFTGDLTPPFAATEDTLEMIQAGWAKIRSAGGKTIYSGHAPAWQLLD